MVSAALKRRPILLTGASGQVGWELRRTLCTLGEVHAVGHQELDLSNLGAVRDAVRLVRPSLIVNSAAYTAVDKAEREREAAMTVNGVAPGVLAEEARTIGAAMVHYSTDYVFDGSGEAAWKEDDATAPLNVYGETKLAGERAVAEVGGAYLILRTQWVYGLNGHNFVKTMLQLGRQREELAIVDDQIGAPTSARVIADITGQVLAQGRSDWAALLEERGGLCNLTCSGYTSWRGFAEAIFALAKARGDDLAIRCVRPIRTAEYPTPARRPLNCRVDLSRLRERFGLVPPPWQLALRHHLLGVGMD
jgi:dTDP-4-dehydrorhamnose reductase